MRNGLLRHGRLTPEGDIPEPVRHDVEYPDLPVVFMWGYTDDDVARRGLLDAGMSFLEKPISPEALTRRMRQVLEGTARKT